MRPRRPFVAKPLHAVTKQVIRVSARTARELARRLYDLDTLRWELENGVRTVAQYDRAVRGFVWGEATIARAACAYMMTVRPNTRRAMASWLAVVAPVGFGDPARFDVHGLDAEACSSWVEALRARGYGEASIGTAWRKLRAIVRYAAEHGWISTVPWGSWRPTRRRENRPAKIREAARTPAELLALLDAARELDTERERAGKIGDVEAKIAAASLIGLRRGEVCGLRWSDLDPRRGIVHVVRQYDDRPLKSPRVPPPRVDAALFEILDRYRVRLAARELFAPSGPLFPEPRTSTPGNPRHYTSGACLSARDLRSVVVKSGLPNAELWSSHSCRDSFATLEHDGAGGNLRVLCARTGHTSYASAERYVRPLARASAPPPGFTLDVKTLPRGSGVESAPHQTTPTKRTPAPKSGGELRRG
jgi:integrase